MIREALHEPRMPALRKDFPYSQNILLSQGLQSADHVCLIAKKLRVEPKPLKNSHDVHSLFRRPLLKDSLQEAEILTLRKAMSPQQTLRYFQHTSARGGIRTHVGLRQRILSPPPCLRLFLAAYLDLARVPSQMQC